MCVVSVLAHHRFSGFRQQGHEGHGRVPIATLVKARWRQPVVYIWADHMLENKMAPSRLFAHAATTY